MDLIFVCKQFVAASKNMKAQLHLNSNIKEKYEDRAKGVRADRIPLRKITLPLVWSLDDAQDLSQLLKNNVEFSR